MDEEKPKDQSSAQADDNSIAIGNFEVRGNVGGNITIGNTYFGMGEEDIPLTSVEIENGLTCFATYLPERAPILQERFASIAKKLRATLGAELSALSLILKTQREDNVNEMKLMCMEVLDISFRALCKGQNPPPYDSRPPFLGLVAFRPEDREFYFGREILIEKLVTALANHPFLAVMGPSGSGKSSLVMAGLIPTLGAQMAYFTPSSTAMENLRTATENAGSETIFVLDQFEELFTLTRDANVREQFIRALLDLTSKNRVVITMRADFWGEVAPYRDLREAMQAHQELIPPMDTAELRQAMEKQAAAVGLRFDQTLSESILDEVEGEPGAMPLLQHALWTLWKRRHGLWLKADEYRAFGGVKQAIASTAEDVYASSTDLERNHIRNIFLRLTRLDDSGEGRDTRRRVLLHDLLPATDDLSLATPLLDKLANARLIVKDENEAEVAHEALIRHWSRLTNWLNEDRVNLRLRESLSDDAREWEKSNRDEALLNHRSGRLELALTLSQDSRYFLNPIEQAYLNACVTAQERTRIEKEQQQQRELTAAKELAETALARAEAERRGRLAERWILGIATILVIVLGYFSYAPIRNEIWRRQVMKSDMATIPSGNYQLGDRQAEEYPGSFLMYQEYPISTFSIETHPVTNRRYELCIRAGVCSRPEAMQSEYKDPKNANKYVVNITAVNAAEFCNWIDMRLPSEKQWEVAMRQKVLAPLDPDALSDPISFFEWTTSQPDQNGPEWLNFASDPPEVLIQRGDQLNADTYITIRQNQGAMISDKNAGFRCASNR